MWRKDQGPQNVNTRESFLSLAGGIPVGAYSLGNDTFIAVSSRHTRLGTGEVTAEILQPQQISYPATDRFH